MINILLIDDHPAVRFGMRSILQLADGLNVAGEASNSDEAMNLLKDTKVDLVMLDLNIPGKDGISTARMLKKEHPALKILAFSIYDDRVKVLTMLKAGADGYLLKSADQREIIEAIHAVMKGEKYVSKELADKVIYDIASGNVTYPGDSQPGEKRVLSRREEEILRMLANDNSYLEIAKQLRISKRTVDTHRYNISKKLGIKSMAGLIRYAINQKLI